MDAVRVHVSVTSSSLKAKSKRPQVYSKLHLKKSLLTRDVCIHADTQYKGAFIQQFGYLGMKIQQCQISVIIKTDTRSHLCVSAASFWFT